MRLSRDTRPNAVENRAICRTCEHWTADQARRDAQGAGWCGIYQTLTAAEFGCESWQAAGSAEPERVDDVAGATPWDRVRIANEIAVKGSRDSLVRRVAAIATQRAGLQADAALPAVAQWIRRSVVYTEETPGIEVLQGPLHTLRYRVGDCDDLAILWCAMTRAIGHRTFFAGVAKRGTPETFYHAVGASMPNRLWELSDESRNGGRLNPPLRFRLPGDSIAVMWATDNAIEGYWINYGRGFKRVTP